MNALPPFTREPSTGFKVRRLRISRHLTRRELADRAGVSSSDVHLFEQSLPVPLDSRRRIFRVLWAVKIR